ncbi:MAG: hypothetical protein AAGJ73_07205 [Pseudomonadota bacterium]
MSNNADRDQGPHYIPELDPDNSKWPKPLNRRPMWIALTISFVLMAAGVAAFFLGFPEVGVIIFLLGLLVLAPFVAFIG